MKISESGRRIYISISIFSRIISVPSSVFMFVEPHFSQMKT
jgi:hypothetical protein